jgi:hypothetical protein
LLQLGHVENRGNPILLQNICLLKQTMLEEKLAMQCVSLPPFHTILSREDVLGPPPPFRLKMWFDVTISITEGTS